jgi:hypothetical protein
MVLTVMLDGYSKQDPPTWKMLPAKADVPSLLVEMGYGKSSTTHAKAIRDLALIAFYYRLQIGEYVFKGNQNNTTQTIQFKLEDIKFFKKNKAGTLVCLPNNTPPILMMPADSATLKLDNQKMSGKAYVYTRKQMGNRSTARCGLLPDGFFTYKNTKQMVRLCSPPFSTRVPIRTCATTLLARS